MNLLNLAPDIQEAILFLPAAERGREAIKERDIRPIAGLAIAARNIGELRPV